MKRSTQYILQLSFVGVLLIAVIGVPVNNHYCGGLFVATTVGIAIEDACSNMPMEDNCCYDETTLYSVTDYFSNPSITFISNITADILSCSYIQCTKLIPQFLEIEIFTDHTPPPSESKIFIEIQSFLL